jgi:hypothetical protein
VLSFLPFMKASTVDTRSSITAHRCRWSSHDQITSPSEHPPCVGNLERVWLDKGKFWLLALFAIQLRGSQNRNSTSQGKYDNLLESYKQCPTRRISRDSPYPFKCRNTYLEKLIFYHSTLAKVWFWSSNSKNRVSFVI